MAFGKSACELQDCIILSRERVETNSELYPALLLPTALFVGLRQTGELD